MDIYTRKQNQVLQIVCKWRPTVIGVDNPKPVPDTEEVLRYLVSAKAYNTSDLETLKQDEELLRLTATTRKRKRRTPLRYSAMKQSKGEGWREIGNQQVWFENAWHANYARFLDRFPDMASRWLYKPKKFRLGPFGVYESTFWVDYVSCGPIG